VSGKPTAETWPWFVLMDEVLGQSYSINPPVLIASIPEDRPGLSSAVGAHGEEEEPPPPAAAPAPPPPAAARRKRDYEEEFLQLMREDMALQREAEERRAQDSREWMDRLFALLERMVEKQ